MSCRGSKASAEERMEGGEANRSPPHKKARKDTNPRRVVINVTPERESMSFSGRRDANTYERSPVADNQPERDNQNDQPETHDLTNDTPDNDNNSSEFSQDTPENPQEEEQNASECSESEDESVDAPPNHQLLRDNPGIRPPTFGLLDQGNNARLNPRPVLPPERDVITIDDSSNYLNNARQMPRVLSTLERDNNPRNFPIVLDTMNYQNAARELWRPHDITYNSQDRQRNDIQVRRDIIDNNPQSLQNLQRRRFLLEDTLTQGNVREIPRTREVTCNLPERSSIVGDSLQLRRDVTTDRLDLPSSSSGYVRPQDISTLPTPFDDSIMQLQMRRDMLDNSQDKDDVREFMKKRGLINDCLERERMQLRQGELRIREFEVREKFRQRDTELRLQAQWLDLMKEGMNLFQSAIDRQN